MTLRKTLNCSSITTTIDSFSAVLNLSRSQIFQRIENKIIKTEKLAATVEESLIEEFFPETTEKSPFETYTWFHLSRVNSEKSYYNKGILPTGQYVEHVWAELERIISEKSLPIHLNEIREKIENDKESRYYNKLNNLSHGPYALLIRETALHGNYCNHYLKCPEIIDDICHGLENLTGVDLENDFTQSRKPAIVHFTTEPPNDFWSFIKEALIYIYQYTIGEDDVASDSSYIGNGKSISPNQIHLIEFVDEPNDDAEKYLILDSNCAAIERFISSIKIKI